MGAYWSFFRREAPLVGFGLLLAFFSSFGQTFFVSLFVPSFLRDFALDNAGFGALYSGATLASALLLPWTGGWIDRARLHRFTVGVVVLLALAAFVVAASPHVAVLFVGLVGLRHGGQGLAGHTARTAMARYYGVDRGKALSIASVGFPGGEAVHPLLFTALIGLVGWRWAWGTVGGAALLLFAPAAIWLLRRSGAELDPREVTERKGPGDVGDRRGREAVGAGGSTGPSRDWSRRQVLRDPRFYLALPAALLPGFWVTGLFLYQTALAEAKGWALPLMASAFVAFAVTRTVVSLAVGGAIDRFSARRLFPFTVLPIGAGIAVLLLSGHPAAAYVFMALLGVTMGTSANVRSALWAELYGIRELGAIKSMMMAIVVLSTAGSPVLVGFVLDRAPDLDGLLLGGVVSIAAGVLLAVPIYGASPREPR